MAFRFSGASDNTSNAVRDRILGAVKGCASTTSSPSTPTSFEAPAKVVHKRRLSSIVTGMRDGRHTSSRHRPVELVEPLANALGMTAGSVTISEIADGIYTGDLAGLLLTGPGRSSITIWRDGRTSISPSATLRDSASDLPMLEAATSCRRQPGCQTERIARHNGWRIVVFSKRTKAVVRRTTKALGTAGVARGRFAAGTATPVVACSAGALTCESRWCECHCATYPCRFENTDSNRRMRTGS